MRFGTPLLALLLLHQLADAQGVNDVARSVRVVVHQAVECSRRVLKTKQVSVVFSWSTEGGYERTLPR